MKKGLCVTQELSKKAKGTWRITYQGKDQIPRNCAFYGGDNPALKCANCGIVHCMPLEEEKGVD